MGMSLGGYTTALFGDRRIRLAFAVPIIPLASLADFAREQGRLGETPHETELQHRALERRAPQSSARSPANRYWRPESCSSLAPVPIASRRWSTRGAWRTTSARRSRAGMADTCCSSDAAEKFRRIGRLLDDLGLTERKPR